MTAAVSVRRTFLSTPQQTIDRQVGQITCPKDQTWSEVFSLPGQHLGLTSLVASAPSKAFPTQWLRCDVSWRCNASDTLAYKMPDQPKITDYKNDRDNRGRDICEEDVLSDLRRVGRILGSPPTISEYEDHGLFSETAVRNRFDTWSGALSEAGFSDVDSNRGQKTVSDEELLEELRQAAREEGHPPRARSDEVQYSDGTYIDRFGSWLNALDEAGVGYEPQQSNTPVHEKIGFSEIVSEIIDIAADKGRPPYEREFKEESSLPVKTTTEVAGSWSETLRMAGFPPRYRGGSYIQFDQRDSRSYGSNWETIRKKVLDRDRWRCQHCGKTNSDHYDEHGAGLHVHHIRPIRSFDRPEDANFLDNLISLCKDCHSKWDPVTELDYITRSDQGGR